VRQDQGRFLIYGTPWHGEGPFAKPGPARLREVFLIGHGSRHACREIPAGTAVGRLLTCSFLPLYNPDAVDFTLGFLEQMVGQVSCRELAFLPDRSVFDYLPQCRA
jgi:hypothetical protein